METVLRKMSKEEMNSVPSSLKSTCKKPLLIALILNATSVGMNLKNIHCKIILKTNMPRELSHTTAYYVQRPLRNGPFCMITTGKPMERRKAWREI